MTDAWFTMSERQHMLKGLWPFDSLRSLRVILLADASRMALFRKSPWNP